MTPSRSQLRGLVIVGLVAVAIVGLCAWSLVSTGDANETEVPMPTEQDGQELASQLARATEVQGICYGWQLTDGEQRSRNRHGSNLGDGIRPSTAGEGVCPRWIELSITVWWTAASSESEDYASISLSSREVTGVTAADLDRVGVNEKAAVDDPVETVARGVLALPLLLTEKGVATPVPVRTEAAGADVGQPADEAGSDFWRDRLWFVLAAAILVLVAALLALFGLRERQRARATTEPTEAPPAPEGSA